MLASSRSRCRKSSAYPGLAAVCARRDRLPLPARKLKKAQDGAGRSREEIRPRQLQAAAVAAEATADPRPPQLLPRRSSTPTTSSPWPKPALRLAEASLAFNEARLAADDANYPAPPAASAKALLAGCGTSRARVQAVRQAEKGLLQAEIALARGPVAPRRKAMPRRLKPLTDCRDGADQRASRPAATLSPLPSKPPSDYTHFTPVYPATSTGRRLALARWITSTDNPLTARVAVNHIWLRHFGTPLVPTVFDFGLNGKPPTNQPLLDWLAVELMENGWRMKHDSPADRDEPDVSAGSRRPAARMTNRQRTECRDRSREPLLLAGQPAADGGRGRARRDAATSPARST